MGKRSSSALDAGAKYCTMSDSGAYSFVSAFFEYKQKEGSGNNRDCCGSVCLSVEIDKDDENEGDGLMEPLLRLVLIGGDVAASVVEMEVNELKDGMAEQDAAF